MTTGTFVGFFTVSLVVCSAPGPSMLFVIHQGLSRERNNVVAGITGLLTANVVWICLTAFGLGAVMQHSQQLFHVVKTCGAIYLLYLGITALFDSKSATSHPQKDTTTSSFIAVFAKGFLTSISNPKGLLWYMAFLPQFVRGHDAYRAEIVFWGLCNLFVLFLVMTSYGILSNRIAHTVNRPGFQKLFRRIIGIGFLGSGVALLTSEPT